MHSTRALSPASLRPLAARWPAVLGVALFAGTLVLDANLPPGYAGAILYVVPVLMGLWVPGRHYVLAVAIAATIASIAARYGVFPPSAVPTWLVWLNRATAIAAVWGTALAVIRYKAAHAAAEVQRVHSRAILETAMDGIVTTDEGGRIELFNRAAEQMFGWRADEVMGRSVRLILPGRSAERIDEYLHRRRDDNAAGDTGLSFEVEGLRKGDGSFPLEVALTEVPLEGRRAFTAILRDITKRKEHEAAREAFVRALAEKSAELEQFTYTVSHDLKSPLVTIKGFLGLLRTSASAPHGDPAQLLHDIGRIEAAADRMKQLLDELLELSRVGRVVGPTGDVALGPLVAEVLEALDGPIRARGVSVAVAPELPSVRGDALRLRQLVQNLVENAVKFMGDTPAPRIEIGARPEHDDVVCWVGDNGAGIDPRYTDKIFGLFEKLDRRTDGTGIGLALARRIVEVHGGRIWVESRGVGQGARFYFTLPAGTRREAA